MVGSLTLMPEASSLFSPVNLSSKEFAHDPDVVYKLTDKCCSQILQILGTRTVDLRMVGVSTISHAGKTAS